MTLTGGSIWLRSLVKVIMRSKLCKWNAFGACRQLNRLLSSNAHAHDRITIDRSGLHKGAGYPAVEKATFADANAELVRHLQSVITFRGGPMSVAEYMSTALAHPQLGYYATQDAIGEQSDFITAPEVSQMPGELIGAWFVHLWASMGAPARVALVELGPGKGNLISDTLRCAQQAAPLFMHGVELHLVEASERMRAAQRQALRTPVVTALDSTNEASGSAEDQSGGLKGSGVERGVSYAFSDCVVMWHNSLDSVPREIPTLVLAHEFFDALPVHQFERTSRGWCERLIDSNEGNNCSSDSARESNCDAYSTSGPLRFVLSPSPTAHSRLLTTKRLEHAQKQIDTSEVTQLECSPKSMTTVDSVAKRIDEAGGAMLVIDYGSEFPSMDRGFTLQAIRNHEFVPLLESAGNSDLSAHVDFGSLTMAAHESQADVKVYGPITQSHFFEELGIGYRADQLMQSATTSELAESIKVQWQRITGTEPSDMGKQYKAWTMVHKDMPVPPGFA